MRVGPDDLLETDLLTVSGDGGTWVQMFGGDAVDDGDVVAGDQVTDALAVAEAFGAVVDAGGEVVEQLLGDGEVEPGDQQLGIAAVSPTV